MIAAIKLAWVFPSNALRPVQKVPEAVAAALEHDAATLIEAPCPQALPPWIETEGR
jgi:hypothetical protein